MTLLNIKNLTASINQQTVMNGLNLTVNAGEIHAIMGPNGSGKSSLANIVAGKEDYDIQSGSILLDDQDIKDLDTTERALAGIFLGFQYPVEVPGVSNVYLLKAALNAKRKHAGLQELDAFEFMQIVKQHLADMEMDQRFLNRGVNEGFSGGEKKRNEILQMRLLEPKLAILDETDSGLDIDALKVVAKGVNDMRSPERAIVLITHYQRLLDYIKPDHVHVLMNGQIVKSGGPELAQWLEQEGYDALQPEAA